MRQVLALEVLFSLFSHALAVVVHVLATTPCPSYATARLRARRESSSTFDRESALSVLSTALKPETSVSSLDDYYEHNLSLDTLIEERSSAAWFTNLPYDVRTWADDFYRNDYVTGPGTTVPYSSAPVYGGGGTTATTTVTAEQSSTSSTSLTNRFDVLPTESPRPSRPSLVASTAAPEPASESKSESPAKIIGITVGIVFSCVFIALLLFLVLRRRRRRQRQGGAASAPPVDKPYEKDAADAKVAPRTAPLPAAVHGEIYELPAPDKGPEMSGSTGYYSSERPEQVHEAMAVEARGDNGRKAQGFRGGTLREAGKWKGYQG